MPKFASYYVEIKAHSLTFCGGVSVLLVCVCVFEFVILIIANNGSRPKVGVSMAINCQFSIMSLTCGSHLLHESSPPVLGPFCFL